MGLISTNIPTLIGGVSQQPYNIRLPSQCEVMENCLPSVVEFLRRRPATQHIAKIMPRLSTEAAAIHTINRDSAERYVVVVVDGQLKVFTLDGQEIKVICPDGTGYLKTASPDMDIAFMTINDYTFILNRSVTTQMRKETTDQRPPEALVFIKQVNYSTEFRVVLDGTTHTHTTPANDDGGNYKLSSTDVAADFAKQIKEQGGFEVRAVKSTLHIRRTDGGEFSIQVEDSRSNSHISLATDNVQRFSDLPVVAPEGYVCEIVGDQSSSFDNYFVMFEVTSPGTDYGQGVWKETVKPGIPYALDASTMPHALVREADGTFSFREMAWTDRICGDEDSAPEPTFIGRKCSSIFFYRNRIGLLANENCVLSEAGKFFNFFPTTVTTMVDSDPVDAAASHTKATNLYHVAPFSEGLILFSDQTQFLLEHDDVLSMKTVAIKPITEFECSVKAQPIGAGKNIFFATSRGRYAGVREYFVEKDSSLTDAADITSHVPHYIEGDIHRLVVSTNEDCLLALADGDRSIVTFYKYFWSGQEKVQSSWSRWQFSGKVLSAAFINSTLLLVVLYEDGLYLESMNIEPGYTDADGAPFEYAVDRKITEQDFISIRYDEDTQQSTIAFPYMLSGKPLIVSRHKPGSTVPPGLVFETVAWDTNAATVAGDCRNIPLYGGIAFRSLYKFSRQVMRENSPNGSLAVTEGRLQLRSFTLTYGETGYFEVHVTPEYRDTAIHIFPGRVLGHGSNILDTPTLHSGTFRFYPLSRAEKADITILSESFLPFQITSAGWEGYFNIRSQRV